MPDYSNGKVYEIICRITNERYIGSTTLQLCQRLANHREKKNKCSSKQIIERNDYYINLLEECPCDNREQLLKNERDWYNKGDCINKRKPFITNEESIEYQIEYQKEYRGANKESISKYKKEYCEANKESISEKKKEYREANKESISEKAKEYYQKKKNINN